MELSSERIVVSGLDGTVRVRPEDVVKVKERHRSLHPRMDEAEEVRLVLVLRDLRHVVLPVRSWKVYHGVKAILAARDGDEDRLLRHLGKILRESRRFPSLSGVETASGCAGRGWRCGSVHPRELGGWFGSS
ncbi:MAG: hypothetical protein ACXQTC_03420 [Methanopyraceae archaeon]